MKLAKSVYAAILALGAFLSASDANAALIDHTTYTTDTTYGLDWLDLTATQGQSVSDALSSESGWSYANDSQVRDLLSSFGITYAFTPGTFTALSATAAQAANFETLFGVTEDPDGSFGGYFNSDVGHSAFLCISSGTCDPTSFTRDLDISAGNSVLGQFLVRASATNVPEPSSIAILVAGLGLIGGATYFGRKKIKTDRLETT
jgi:hypothetical protein